MTGVGAVLLIQGRGPGAKPQSPPSEASAGPRVMVPGRDYATEQRLDALEARLRDLARAKEERDGSATPETPAAIEDRQAATERFAQNVEEEIAIHRSEPRDNRWATEKERFVHDEVTRVSAKLGSIFSVVGVDCRRTTCVAQLQWPSEGEARASLHGLLSSSGNVGCARRIALPPSTSAGDYRASLFIDCTGSM